MAKMINCPYCGKLTDPKLESCPHCGGFLLKKQPSAKTAGQQGKTQTCPNCHAVVQEGDIICVACGTNLLTGHKIAEERPKKKAGWKLSPAWIIGAVGVTIAVVLIGFAVWVLSGDPVKQAVDRAAQGDVGGALRILREYTARNPGDARAFMELGRIEFRADPPSAADAFERVVEIEPDNTEAALMVVLSLASSSSPEARRRQVAALKRVVTEQPENRAAWFLLGLAQGATDNPADQIDALDRVVKLEDGAVARQHLGIAYALKGDYVQAEEQLKLALEKEPENADISAALGFVQEIGGNREAAVERLKASAGAASTEREALLELGTLLLEQGDYSAAVPYLAQAVERYGGSEDARFYYALALHGLGRDDEALQLCEGLAREGGAHGGGAGVVAATIHLDRGATDRAREFLDMASRLGEASAALYTLRGRLNVLSGDPIGARDAFRQSMQADPAYAPAYLENGLLYVNQQSFGDAINDLQRYVDLANPNVEGTRVGEVTALIEQLKEAATPAAPDASSQPAATGEVI